jgi:protein tyrosine phosphatase (PTP) superfamily phosphohydrolase (DUF442 family)
MIQILLVTVISALAATVSLKEAKHYGRFYVSGEPQEAELIKFKKQKGAVVVDLRNFDELGSYSEPSKVAKAGLQYSQVNFDAKADSINQDVISGIDKVVRGAGDKPVLLFCKSGNRAASYVAIHLVRDQKMPIEDAVKIAKDLGMTEKMEPKVRAYLKANP